MRQWPRNNPEHHAVSLHLTNSASRTARDVAVGADNVSLGVPETVIAVALIKSVCYWCSWVPVAYTFPLLRVDELASVTSRGRRISAVTGQDAIRERERTWV